MSALPATRPRLPRWVMAATAVTGVIVAAIWIAVAIPASRAAAPAPVLTPCQARSLVPCYGQDPLHRVYGMGALYQRGITGAVTTIAVIAPYLGPWLTSDLTTYARWLRLPAPRLRVIGAGHTPAARPGNRQAAAWTREVTADLEIAHFMAPMARLRYRAVVWPASGPLVTAVGSAHSASARRAAFTGESNSPLAIWRIVRTGWPVDRAWQC